nr:Arc family DNA-binding protein [Bradyrhizobium sp. 6(2017)]
MVVRIPRETKAWLERKASENLRSQNSEIIIALRRQMEAEAAD